MSFASKDLSVLAYANGFTLWHYTSPDPAATVDGNGYFDQAADMLRTGDMILANTGTGGPSPAAGILLVARTTGGTVDVADLTVVGGTNTD